jgi:hypothetical protein
MLANGLGLGGEGLVGELSPQATKRATAAIANEP